METEGWAKWEMDEGVRGENSSNAGVIEEEAVEVDPFRVRLGGGRRGEEEAVVVETGEERGSEGGNGQLRSSDFENSLRSMRFQSQASI